MMWSCIVLVDGIQFMSQSILIANREPLMAALLSHCKLVGMTSGFCFISGTRYITPDKFALPLLGSDCTFLIKA